VTVTSLWPSVSSRATVTVPASTCGVTRAYRMRRPDTLSTTTHVVVGPWAWVSKTVPGVVSSATAAAKCGFHCGTHSCSPPFGSGVFGQITSGAGAQSIDARAVIGVGGEHGDLDVGVSCSRRRRALSTASQPEQEQTISL
jgi:hypothetical protein